MLHESYHRVQTDGRWQKSSRDEHLSRAGPAAIKGPGDSSGVDMCRPAVEKAGYAMLSFCGSSCFLSVCFAARVWEVTLTSVRS